MPENLQDFFDSQAQTATEAAPDKPKKERKKRQPRKPPVEQQATPTEPAPKKRGRKPSVAKERKARSAKIDLAVAIEALSGLKADEAQMVTRAAATLSGLPKRSRARIAAALGRLFA